MANFVRLNELQEALGQAVFSSLAGVEWVSATLSYRELNLVGEAEQMTVSLTDGREVLWDLPTGFMSLLGRARRTFMVEPGKGTWYSAEVTLTRAGHIDINFNYDKQPSWDIPRDDEEYLLDNELYPRATELLPSWHPASASHRRAWKLRRRRRDRG